MVHQVLARTVVGIGRTGHQYDRQILGISAADRVDGGEPANTEGDHGGGRAARASVTFGTIAAVEFVTAIYLLKLLIRQKLVKQDQVEIARYRKMMLEPNL